MLGTRSHTRIHALQRKYNLEPNGHELQKASRAAVADVATKLTMLSSPIPQNVIDNAAIIHQRWTKFRPKLSRIPELEAARPSACLFRALKEAGMPIPVNMAVAPELYRSPHDQGPIYTLSRAYAKLIKDLHLVAIIDQPVDYIRNPLLGISLSQEVRTMATEKALELGKAPKGKPNLLAGAAVYIAGYSYKQRHSFKDVADAFGISESALAIKVHEIAQVSFVRQ
jgi:transcription initiation factor TFIIIB Brf1 subunit/transcription initiation factor TFIIB